MDELLAALGRAIESGHWLDYGGYVIGELERVRDEVAACQLLLRSEPPAVATVE